MMIFYRSKAAEKGRGPSLRTIRTLVAVSLCAYPVGGLIMALAPDEARGVTVSEGAGLALIVTAFFAAAPVVGSQFQKIVGEVPQKLDEFELKVRQRAISAAYAAFTAITLLATIYAAIASDAGLWVPRTYDEFNGLFWGVFLYAVLLPTAFLVWQPDLASQFVEDDQMDAAS